VFELRILQWSWGLHIDLRAQASIEVEQPTDCVKVAPRTWIQMQAPTVGDDGRTRGVSEIDKPQIIAGLAMRAAEIEALRPDGQIVVRVIDLEYPLTDYQPEGVVLAMLGWIGEEFGLDDPPVTVTFDQAANQYVVDFDNPPS
jgi:hypothetical protein